MEKTSTGLSTSLRQCYTNEESNFITNELKRLSVSRQEKYPIETMFEWINSFFEKGITAQTACRMISAVRINTKVFGKLNFSDFINADISGIKNTTSLYNDPTAHFLIVLTCSNCGRTTTVKKLDAFDFPRNIKCAKCSRILTPDKLSEFAKQISENFEEFKY